MISISISFLLHILLIFLVHCLLSNILFQKIFEILEYDKKVMYRLHNERNTAVEKYKMYKYQNDELAIKSKELCKKEIVAVKKDRGTKKVYFDCEKSEISNILQKQESKDLEVVGLNLAKKIYKKVLKWQLYRLLI